MRIVLANAFNPGLSWFFYSQGMASPPYGTCRAAGRLARLGHDVRVLDGQRLQMETSRLAEEIVRTDPMIVVIGAFPELHLHTFMGTSAFPHDIDLCAEVRKRLPKARILIGGYIPGIFPRDAIRLSGADGIVRTLDDLACGADEIQEEGSDAMLGFRLLQPAVSNYGIDPRFFLDRERIQPRPVLPILGATGCPHRCAFCATPIHFQGRYRERSLDQVLEEIATGVRDSGVRAWSVWDDTFTVRQDRLISFCRGLVQRGLDVRWWCFGQAHWILQHRDLLPIMRQAGCRMVWIGAESVDRNRLDAYRKGITPSEVARAAEALLEAELLPTMSFLFGEPDDDRSSLSRRLQASRQIQDMGCVNVYTLLIPVPGTTLFRELENRGRITRRDLRLFSGVRAVLELPGLSQEELEEEFLRAYSESVLSERWTRAFGRANLWEEANSLDPALPDLKELKNLAEVEFRRLQQLEKGPGREVDPCSLVS